MLMADIDTLGGAGFASQRYRFGPEPLHLPRTTYQGVTLTIHPSSSASEVSSTSSSPRANTFTLVLKTSLNTRPPSRPKTPPQPDPASLSYEASFTPSKQAKDAAEVVNLAFDDFKVTYRGREVPKHDPRWQPFHSEKIYELSLMCRSDFGGQKGDFEVVVGDIAGWEKDGNAAAVAGADDASQWRVVSWARSVWGALSAIVVGFWIWAKGAADGKIALPDEEKDPLI